MPPPPDRALHLPKILTDKVASVAPVLTSVKLASYSASNSDFSQSTSQCQVWDADHEYDLYFIQGHLQVQLKVKRRGTG